MSLIDGHRRPVRPLVPPPLKGTPTRNENRSEDHCRVPPAGSNGAPSQGDGVTDRQRLSLSVETIELAKVAAELREAGRRLEADRVAIRVAENAERLAST